MESGRLTVAMLADETRRILSSATVQAAAYVVLLTALSTALEALYPEFALDGGSLVITLLDMAAMYLLIRALILRSGLAGETVGGFWIYVGTAIVAGIATVIGLVLLVIPGIVLSVRWAPAFGFAIAGNEGVSDALGKAWKATEGHFRSILAAIIVPFALSMLGGTLSFFAADDAGTMPLAWLSISNLLIYAGGLFTIAIGLAAYSLLSDRSAEIAEVFD